MSALSPDRSAPKIDTAYRVCPLCEATCGLELTITGGAIRSVRGDREDVFSKGFICPKGVAFDRLDNDPDRLRRPMVREGEQWREVGWDEAFAVVAAGRSVSISGTRTSTPSPGGCMPRGWPAR